MKIFGFFHARVKGTVIVVVIGLVVLSYFLVSQGIAIAATSKSTPTQVSQRQANALSEINRWEKEYALATGEQKIAANLKLNSAIYYATQEARNELNFPTTIVLEKTALAGMTLPPKPSGTVTITHGSVRASLVQGEDFIMDDRDVQITAKLVTPLKNSDSYEAILPGVKMSTGQGVIVIKKEFPFDIKEIITQAKTGKLRIVDWNGDILKLSTETGDTYYFNIVTEQLTTSAGDGKLVPIVPIPTIAPKMNATPVPYP